MISAFFKENLRYTSDNNANDQYQVMYVHQD